MLCYLQLFQFCEKSKKRLKCKEGKLLNNKELSEYCITRKQYLFKYNISNKLYKAKRYSRNNNILKYQLLK